MRAIMLKPDDSQFIEQGFSAVVNMAVKIEDGRELFLVQERNKVPYKGTIAFSGDKIYYGEDVASAAKRAFLLQTGLEADVELRSIWHIKEKYESKIIQDKFFYMHLATNLRGQLQPVGLTGNNLWMTIEELEASDKTLHGFINTLHSVQSLPLTFHETTIEVASY